MRVLATGLSNPTGIALLGDQLFVSQASGGKGDSAIARIDANSGALTLVHNGPATPSAIAVDQLGHLYWVSASDGTLMVQDAPGDLPRVLRSGLHAPAGLAVDTFGQVYVSETPASRSGSDAAGISVVSDTDSRLVYTSGPDPTSIAVGRQGDVYWTSQTDGLIYHLGQDGKGDVLVSGLDSPSGIALDTAGQTLYFTEVPTPGVSGENGGHNTVNALDLTNLARTVINRGDPMPTGVAADGRSVYWTSVRQGQGAVIEANRTSSPVVVSRRIGVRLSGAEEVPSVSTKATGSASFRLNDPSSSGENKSAGLSFSLSTSGLKGVTETDLHLGAKGQSGPVVAIISKPGRRSESESDNGESNGGKVDGVVRSADLQGPFAGNWDGFTNALNGGQIYINVHTSARPSGEIRGQIPSSGGSPTPNTAPHAVITSPGADVTITAGQPVSFAGTASDPDGDMVTVRWSFGDGSTSALLAPGNHTYATAGTFTVTFTATDSKGLVDPAPSTRTITVTGVAVNRAPHGTITTPAANASITAGQAVSFAGTATDPDGDMVTVIWSFGDGSTSTTLAPGNHTYATAGTFTVTFTATDSKGLVDPAPSTRTITVTPVAVNRAPHGTITSPAANASITAGQAVSFAGTATDPDGDAVTVLWSFGDGSTSTVLAPGNHTYATAGTFAVTFTATDSKGLVDPAPSTRTITVTPVAVNRAPHGTITSPSANASITAGQAVSFAGTATDPDGDAVTALWSFGDGSTSTVLAPGNHTYATAGTFTVAFTATDSKGLVDPAPSTRTITVSPAVSAPTLSAIQTAIFTPNCTGCHSAGGSAGMNLTAGNAYSNLVNVQATTFSQKRVVPGNPAASAIVIQLQSGHRSQSAANQKMISDWITAGALNN